MAEYSQHISGEIGVEYTNLELATFISKGIQPPIAHSSDFYKQEARRKSLIAQTGSIVNAKKTGKW